MNTSTCKPGFVSLKDYTCGIFLHSLASEFAALLSIVLLSAALLLCTFNASVEAKCTLGVAVCRFSGVL